MLMILRRYTASSHLLLKPHATLCCSRYQSNFSEDNMNGSGELRHSTSSVDRNAGSTTISGGLQLSPLLSQYVSPISSSEIVVVDLDTWRVSSGLAQLSRSTNYKPEKRLFVPEEGNSGDLMDEPDFDEIEDMRVRGNLFYKIDRGSIEFEEYKFDFHGKRSKEGWKVNKDPVRDPPTAALNEQKSLKSHEDNISTDDKVRRSNSSIDSFCDTERISMIIKEKYVVCASSAKDMVESSHRGEKKRGRSPTFNQLTGPYHEPFCLDVYISKASVRACVVHRATSKVVAVAHSISKDMKFDLRGSTRNVDACAAVGRVLAQRALADDIHDVIFTPRKGERVEGKLQVVVAAVTSGGVNVKVKLKQRNVKKSGSNHHHTTV